MIPDPEARGPHTALQRLAATAALAGIILAVGWFVEAMQPQWLYMAGTLVGLWLADAWRAVWHS